MLNSFSVPDNKFSIKNINLKDFIVSKVMFDEIENDIYSFKLKAEDFVLKVTIVDCSIDTKEYCLILTTDNVEFGFLYDFDSGEFNANMIFGNSLTHTNIGQLSILVNSIEKLRNCSNFLIVEKNEIDRDNVLAIIDQMIMECNENK